MASKLPQLQTKFAQASQYVAKHGGARYKQLLEQNKQYIQKPPSIEKCQTLANELFYTRLARREMKVENAGIGVLFGLGCLAWFYGAEIVGRGFTLTGYHV